LSYREPRSSHISAFSHSVSVQAALLYAVFLTYASLVPLEFQPVALGTFYSRVEQIPFLDLQIYSRGDWIANGLLFIPLGFLLCAAAPPGPTRVGTASLVFLGCAALAASIEFAQIAFPPRTVSRNDIYAETIGAGAGVLIWLLGGDRIATLCANAVGKGERAIFAIGLLYALFYIVATLLPFDFVLSWDEFGARLSRNPPSLISCDGTLRCGLDLVVEVAAFVPLAFVLFASARRLTIGLLVFAAAAGGLTGLILEATQLATYSGNVEVISILTRAVGLTLGAVALIGLRSSEWDLLRRAALSVSFVAIVPYFLILAYANRWHFPADFVSLPEFLDLLGQVSFVPFYYHYYNTEANALKKVLVQALMYAPIGAYIQLLQAGPPAPRWRLAGVVAVLVAIAAGLGRLVLDQSHPDPTNLVVAFSAAALTTMVVARVAAELNGRGTRSNTSGLVSSSFLNDPPDSRMTARIGSLLFGSAGVALAIIHPTHGHILLPVVLVVFALVLISSSLWLVLVPVAVPALDFYTASGWFVLDELDVVLCAVFSARLWKGGQPLAALERSKRSLLVALLGLFYALVIVSGVEEFWTSSFVTIHSLVGYDGPQNSLRLLKTFGWTLALWWLIESDIKDDEPETIRRLAVGMGLSLLIASVWLVWERQLFTGLFDMDQAWRASGALSSMHVGGAAMDTHLVMSMPFLFLMFSRCSLSAKTIAMVSVPVVAYAVYITFTRATYLAASFALLFVFAGYLLLWLRRGGALRVAALSIVLLAGVGLTIPAIFVSDYMKSRWLDLGSSMVSRSAHWTSSIALVPDTLRATLFGAGLGSFPSVFQDSLLPDERAAAAIWRKDDGETFLRIGRGRQLYIDQSVELKPFDKYEIRIRVRSEREIAVNVLLCRKHLMNSSGCSAVALLSQPGGDWKELAVTVNSGVVGLDDESTGLVAPAVLTLAAHIRDAVLDVASVELIARSGQQLIHNSDFRDGLVHWSYTQDDHLLWQAKNLWIQLYVELGLVGCLLLTVVLIGSAARLLRSNSGRRDVRLVLVASLIAVGVMATSDSIINAPRTILLLMLVLHVSLSLPLESGSRQRSPSVS
jgi:VanZ family protein